MRRQRWTLQKLYGSECMRLTTKHASHEEGHFFCCRFLILLNFIQHIFPREISSCLMFSSATNFVACVIRAENVPWSVIPKDPIMPTQFWNGKRRNFYHFISNESTYIKNIVIYSFTKNCLKMRPFSNSCRFTYAFQITFWSAACDTIVYFLSPCSVQIPMNVSKIIPYGGHRCLVRGTNLLYA